MVQLKKEEAYYNESYYDESIEMPTKGDCLFAWAIYSLVL